MKQSVNESWQARYEHHELHVPCLKATDSEAI